LFFFISDLPQILAICARHLKSIGRLKNNIVVSTVMSNMGLGEALKEMGIENVITGVGDRYVMEEMHKQGAVIGGEESDHTVFWYHQTTGDGMLTALKLLEAMAFESKPLSKLKKVIKVFPQVLINGDVISKSSLDSLFKVMAANKNAEKELDSNGRILVRYSGTQAQCGVMVEGCSQKK